MPTPVALHWSSGKDAALALHRLQKNARYTITRLLTTLSVPYDRIVMHGVRRELLEAQAAALGLPLQIVPLPASSSHDIYQAAISTTYEELQSAGISTIAFGDIFLEDLRAYREEGLARLGMQGLFPLWKENTRSLVREMATVGIRATVVCVDASKLNQTFLGRAVDEHFLADLPTGVDACGENGEFHTFVSDGPMFSKPVSFFIGEAVHRTHTGEPARDGEGFYFLDLLPA